MPALLSEGSTGRFLAACGRLPSLCRRRGVGPEAGLVSLGGPDLQLWLTRSWKVLRCLCWKRTDEQSAAWCQSSRDLETGGLSRKAVSAVVSALGFRTHACAAVSSLGTRGWGRHGQSSPRALPAEAGGEPSAPTGACRGLPEELL